jgi:hypothetical protein
MFVFLKKVKGLENECGFEIYVPQDSLRGCWRGTNPAEWGIITKSIFISEIENYNEK